MPIYKLHEAPRADPSFSNEHAANLPPVSRVPPQSQATPASVPSSSSSSAPATMSSSAAQENPVDRQSLPPSLDAAHFGHSNYFIEHLFPSKLWRILDDAERLGYDNIISWVDDGMAFQIRKYHIVRRIDRRMALIEMVLRLCVCVECNSCEFVDSLKSYSLCINLLIFVDDREMVIPILEMYFSVSKYKSFLRQLQAYGFQRANPNPEDDPCKDSKPKKDSLRGKWFHELFRRDKMNLCNKMTRDGSKTKLEKDDETTPEKSTDTASPKSGGSPPKSLLGNPKNRQQKKETTAVGKLSASQKRLEKQRHLQFLHHRSRMLQQQQQKQQQQQQRPRATFPRQQHQSFPFVQRQHHHHLSSIHPGATNGAGFPQTMSARVQQQQKEVQHRRQVQMQLNHMKERQMVSSILNGRGKVPGKAPNAAPTAAPTRILAGVNYNKIPMTARTPAATSAAKKGNTESVSEAADEIRRAERALAERRWRLAEAQERAKKEAEALAQAEAAIKRAKNPSSPSLSAKLPPSTAATKRAAPVSTPGKNQAASKKRIIGELPLSSILAEIDHAFGDKTSKSPATSFEKSQAKAGKDQLKITEEELLRAKATATTKSPDGLVHASRPIPSTSAPGNASAETSTMMTRINTMEHMRMKEHQQQPLGRQDLFMKIATAEREELEQRQRLDAKLKPDPSRVVVRDALRNAGVGLVRGVSTGTSAGVASSINPSSSFSVPQRPFVSKALMDIPQPGIVSKEMMDIFAKTAAAVISSKSSDGDGDGDGDGVNSSKVATTANSKIGSPTNTIPSSPSQPPAAAGLAPIVPKGVTPVRELGGVAKLLPGKSPSAAPIGANPTSLPISNSHIVSTSELNAARELMKIPGTVEQTSSDPMRGHWELVRPEELKKGLPLANALPEVVNKSSVLSYDSYKTMAQKLTPPKVMRIPNSWNAAKEPLYLVVDPANATTSSLASRGSL